ncbi:hypothetical protein TR51_24380 [Kitasatospora griseola]|uniref:Uncharacterized protein n=1 Tax=Kitasatospora griseola TaxID=2064 RepID=A0A0D0PP66_KITGR|nr:hypothetical protein [Kitasatospora griseola]KIQ62252.1 hypothetical protein TR51_24380 [Kitasatospora griseola]
MTRPAAPSSHAVRPSAAARPGPVQVVLGALIAATSAVVLLAVSGETGVWRVAVLVAFAVALGTLSAVLLTTRPRVPAAAAAPAPPARRPEYAHQSR